MVTIIKGSSEQKIDKALKEYLKMFSKEQIIYIENWKASVSWSALYAIKIVEKYLKSEIYDK